MPKKGKSYHNFMEKKFYHPTSYRNLERVWVVKQEIEAKEKAIAERIIAHKRENDEMETRILMGDKKAKLGVAFMYDEPPGMDGQTERANRLLGNKAVNPADLKNGIHKELLGQGPHGTNKFAKDQVAQYKFEWQRNAPRNKYLNDADHVDLLNMCPTDKPFGIEVRNVMCIKCKKWGHCATDRDCPHYGEALKDIPERAADLAEKRRYLAGKYGEGMGDDLELEDEPVANLDIGIGSKNKNQISRLRENGQVLSDVKLRRQHRLKSKIHQGGYAIIGSDKESSSSSSASSSSDDDEPKKVEWTANDKERILQRLQELQNGKFSLIHGGPAPKKVKKEAKVKREAKVKKEEKESKVKKEYQEDSMAPYERKSKKSKKEKKSKKSKKKKRKLYSDSSESEWEEFSSKSNPTQFHKRFETVAKVQTGYIRKDKGYKTVVNKSSISENINYTRMTQKLGR